MWVTSASSQSATSIWVTWYKLTNQIAVFLCHIKSHGTNYPWCTLISCQSNFDDVIGRDVTGRDVMGGVVPKEWSRDTLHFFLNALLYSTDTTRIWNKKCFLYYNMEDVAHEQSRPWLLIADERSVKCEDSPGMSETYWRNCTSHWLWGLCSRHASTVHNLCGHWSHANVLCTVWV